jgi:hypothetical protein
MLELSNLESRIWNLESPMKRLIAGVLTVGMMVLLVRSGMRWTAQGFDPSAPAAVDAQPFEGAEARVIDLLERAREGDVTAYLDAFTGSLRQRIEQEVAEKGRDAFVAKLRHAAESRKGHAIFAPESDGSTDVLVTVESVYLDHNERQTYRLERGASGWHVTDVETIRSRVPVAQFGSRARFREPEGVPIPTEPGLEDIAP